MVCRCEDASAAKFISSIFSQCIIGSQQLASFVIGWFSICCWFFTYFPQIRLNLLLKKSEAVSIVFLLMWFVGDCCNVISNFLLAQILTSKVLSIFFVSCDVMLLCEHFYFSRTKRSYKSSPTNYSNGELLSYLTVILFVASNLTWAGQYLTSVVSGQPSKYPFCSEPVSPDPKSGRYITGYAIAFVCCPCYTISRVFQAVKNMKRKSVYGLSSGMFVASALGNLSQVVSFLTFSVDHDYIIKSLPYILAYAIPLLVDLWVLTQFCIYSKNQPIDTDVIENEIEIKDRKEQYTKIHQKE
ncbi:Seven_transmembrane protein 1 [Hexamita inflata]|uniref:Seven_transmembrane protein 1 n=1 Tax=Hexamita inflata TaxID=28002 RepID=A0ABP1HH72_9EUKA